MNKDDLDKIRDMLPNNAELAFAISKGLGCSPVALIDLLWDKYKISGEYSSIMKFGNYYLQHLRRDSKQNLWVITTIVNGEGKVVYSFPNSASPIIPVNISLKLIKLLINEK